MYYTPRPFDRAEAIALCRVFFFFRGQKLYKLPWTSSCTLISRRVGGLGEIHPSAWASTPPAE